MFDTNINIIMFLVSATVILYSIALIATSIIAATQKTLEQWEDSLSDEEYDRYIDNTEPLFIWGCAFLDITAAAMPLLVGFSVGTLLAMYLAS